MGANISSPTKRAMIKTGIYTGNGVDNRNIDIGIDLAAKVRKWLIIKDSVNDIACHRSDIVGGDDTIFFTAQTHLANLIQSFTSSGFQVGDDIRVNEDLGLYYYIIIWEEP